MPFSSCRSSSPSTLSIHTVCFLLTHSLFSDPLMRYANVGMRKFVRDSSSNSPESRVKLRRTKIIIGVQTFTTVLFTIWLLYVWIKGSRFGSQPECNHLVKYVFFYANVRATETWLRVLFIIYLVFFSCTLLLRFILIVFVYADGYHKPQDASAGRWQGSENAYAYLSIVLSVGCASSTKSTCYKTLISSSGQRYTVFRRWS
jgi:hypothetical protein